MRSRRLDLALFVSAQHDGVLGRVEIETNNGFQFLGELGIVADLEVRDRWGFRPCLCQIRRTLFSLSLAALAMTRVLQCVALMGLLNVVSLIIDAQPYGR